MLYFKPQLNIQSQSRPTFGSCISSRSFSSTAYRYGFNGKETEADGTADNYDFGARIYDGRLGRWLAVDPKIASYPWFSPFIGHANNPARYVDFDVKDYGVYIDHTNKTITIKATYYTLAGDASKCANMGIEKWNNESGNFQYKCKDELGNEKVYSIQFDLKVIECADEKTRDDLYNGDKSGESNLFQIGDPGDGNWGTTKWGVDGGYNKITVVNTKGSKKRQTFAHEIGHTLGMDHWTTGLMEAGESRKITKRGNRVTLGMISKILNIAGVGKLVEPRNDWQESSTPDPGDKATLHNPTDSSKTKVGDGTVERTPEPKKQEEPVDNRSIEEIENG